MLWEARAFTVSGLLERDGELRAIGELVQRARAGRGCVGTVEGPAGIGKSAARFFTGQRVAGLAASGLSNREIAQTLFVTTSTVETQLRHAFRKLGIASRDQLSPALAAGYEDVA